MGPLMNPLWTSPKAPSPSRDSRTRALDGISHSSSRGRRFRSLCEFEPCLVRLQKSGSRSLCNKICEFLTGHRSKEGYFCFCMVSVYLLLWEPTLSFAKRISKVFLYLKNSHHFAAPVRQVAATCNNYCDGEEQRRSDWYQDDGKQWQKTITILLILVAESTLDNGEICMGITGELKVTVLK